MLYYKLILLIHVFEIFKVDYIHTGTCRYIDPAFRTGGFVIQNLSHSQTWQKSHVFVPKNSKYLVMFLLILKLLYFFNVYYSCMISVKLTFTINELKLHMLLLQQIHKNMRIDFSRLITVVVLFRIKSCETLCTKYLLFFFSFHLALSARDLFISCITL